MATDVILDEVDGTFVVIDGRVAKITGTDLMLDSPGRRRSPNPPFRRALTHGFDDGLSINHNGDYPGGITLAGTVSVTGNLVARGGLTIAEHGITVTGQPSIINLNVQETLSDLKNQISLLTARVATLESHR